MPSVSSTDIRLYNFIRDFTAAHGYGPSRVDMQVGLGWASSSVPQHHIRRLKLAGLVTEIPGAARTIRVVEVAEPLLDRCPICNLPAERDRFGGWCNHCNRAVGA